MDGVENKHFFNNNKYNIFVVKNSASWQLSYIQKDRKITSLIDIAVFRLIITQNSSEKFFKLSYPNLEVNLIRLYHGSGKINALSALFFLIICTGTAIRF